MKANLEAVAKALGEKVSDVTAVILDRERHADIIRECRDAGARIRLIPDGDVAGAISVAWRNSGNDILFGIGGTPEGRHRGVRAQVPRRLDPGQAVAAQRRANARAALDVGYDLDQVLMLDDLVAGDDVFFAATGITDGELLRGVRYWGDGASTQSLVMRSKSGTIRKSSTPRTAGRSSCATRPSSTADARADAASVDALRRTATSRRTLGAQRRGLRASSSGSARSASSARASRRAVAALDVDLGRLLGDVGEHDHLVVGPTSTKPPCTANALLGAVFGLTRSRPVVERAEERRVRCSNAMSPPPSVRTTTMSASPSNSTCSGETSWTSMSHA